MAVVFISPKRRQRMFFTAITVLFLLLLGFISLGVFVAGPQNSLAIPSFNKPKVNIDMSIFNSAQFKQLQPFVVLQTQYSYTALTAENQQTSGVIYADSGDQATTILESTGLKVISIVPVEIGRDNPFTPYYQSAPAVPAKAPTSKTTSKTVTK